MKKMAKWQLADLIRHINCNYQVQKAEFVIGVLTDHLFLTKAQNNCTNKQLQHKYLFASQFKYITDIHSGTIFSKIQSLGFDD